MSSRAGPGAPGLASSLDAGGEFAKGHLGPTGSGSGEMHVCPRGWRVRARSPKGKTSGVASGKRRSAEGRGGTRPRYLLPALRAGIPVPVLGTRARASGLVGAATCPRPGAFQVEMDCLKKKKNSPQGQTRPGQLQRNFLCIPCTIL